MTPTNLAEHDDQQSPPSVVPSAASIHLELLTKSASKPVDSDARFYSYFLQSAARELLPYNRIRSCLRAIIPGRDTVEVWRSARTRRAYYMNLMVCGQIWVCPVCATKIAGRRADILSASLNSVREFMAQTELGQWRVYRERAFYPVMVAFTLSHHARESLAGVMVRLRKAFKRFGSGRRASDFNAVWRVIGTIRGIEVTYGDNGWHPHIHVIYVMSRDMTPDEKLQFEYAIKTRWIESAKSVGAHADRTHGAKLSDGDRDVGRYVVKADKTILMIAKKWGSPQELALSFAKRGRHESMSLWELLGAYAGGSVKAGELWLEAQAALKGARQIVYSRGLQLRLGIASIQDDDHRLASERESGEDILLATLSLAEWRAISTSGRRAECLQIASGGDRLVFREWVSGVMSGA